MRGGQGGGGLLAGKGHLGVDEAAEHAEVEAGEIPPGEDVVTTDHHAWNEEREKVNLN